METEKTIADLLDEANQQYTRAMIAFFISGLTLGVGITYWVLN